MSFRVLVVCTGNICRSPVAERLLRARMVPGADVAVRSAGTNGLTDHEIDAQSALALREIGVDSAGHYGRRIEPDMLRDVDLVLTATTEHRRIVLELEPRLLQKTFTLREFARLSAQLHRFGRSQLPTADELRERTAQVARQRGQGDPSGAATNDIADPFGGTMKAARASVTEISAAVDAILDGLQLRPADTSGYQYFGRAAAPQQPSATFATNGADPLNLFGGKMMSARHRA